MSDAAIVAAIGAVSAGVGAVVTYFSTRTTVTAAANEQHRNDARADRIAMIGYLQTELTRVTAERDRYLAQLLEDAGLMHEARKVIEAVVPVKQEGPAS